MSDFVCICHNYDEYQVQLETFRIVKDYLCWQYCTFSLFYFLIVFLQISMEYSPAENIATAKENTILY